MVAQLTRREREILRLRADGYTTKFIAGRLFISTKTVDKHMENIRHKTGIRNLADMIKHAIRINLIPDPSVWAEDRTPGFQVSGKL